MNKIDKFGSGINFNIAGKDHYQTKVGSLITLSIYIIVLIYGSQKFTKVVNRSDTSFQKRVDEINQRQDNTFTLGQLDLNIMFGILRKDFLPVVDYSDYVEIVASEYTNYVEDGYPR